MNEKELLLVALTIDPKGNCKKCGQKMDRSETDGIERFECKGCGTRMSGKKIEGYFE